MSDVKVLAYGDCRQIGNVDGNVLYTIRIAIFIFQPKLLIMYSFCMQSRGFIIAILLVVGYSCSNSDNPADENVITIDVKKVYNEPFRTVLLSEFVREIEYVKLETNEDCLVAGSALPYDISENYILIHQYDPERLMLFSRDGKYLNDIGKFGQGPGEYSSCTWPIQISPDENSISFPDNASNIFLYHIDGSFIKRIKPVAAYLRRFGQFKSGDFFTYTEKSYLPPGGGYQIKFYDENLNPKEKVMFSERDTTFTGSSPTDFVALWRDNILFKQRKNDTAFLIDQSGVLSPYMVLNLGKLLTPIKAYPELVHDRYMHPIAITELNNYCLILFRGHPRKPSNTNYDIEFESMIYNRTLKESYFLDEHPVQFDNEIMISTMPINDLDGVLETLLTETKNSQCAEKLDVLDAKTCIVANNVDPDKLITDKYYKKLCEIISESNIDDNPIVRIFHLK